MKERIAIIQQHCLQQMWTENPESYMDAECRYQVRTTKYSKLFVSEAGLAGSASIFLVILFLISRYCRTVCLFSPLNFGATKDALPVLMQQTVRDHRVSWIAVGSISWSSIDIVAAMTYGF